MDWKVAICIDIIRNNGTYLEFYFKRVPVTIRYHKRVPVTIRYHKRVPVTMR